MYLTDNDPTHTCNISLMALPPEEDVCIAEVETTEGEPHVEALVAGPPSTIDLMRLVGHYRLKRCLGRGTTGSVWQADDLEIPGREVALKLMHADTHDEYMLARYNSEVRALARMDDPHIARIWEHGRTSDGKLYIAMELVQGIHLTKFCETWSPSLADRLRLIIQVCRGMQHAHLRGILHRDLKPANVLVSYLDGLAIPKIIDFGLAKSTMAPLIPGSPDTTQMGCLLGTIGYMSPEQASTGVRDVDTRSDVYSIAVMLYELLTDTLPIPREELNRVSLSQALDMIQNRDGDAASRRVSRHPGSVVHASRMHLTVEKLQQSLVGDLDAILEKGLRKERELRYQSAGELADDLERYLAGTVVHARQRTWWYLAEKSLKRHWKLALGIGLITMLFLASWVGMAFGFYHAVVARNQADQAHSALSIAKDHETTLKQDAEKSSAFLERILSAPNPSRMGQDVKLLDALDAARETITTTFVNQPRAEAMVRIALARSYLRLHKTQSTLDTLQPINTLPLDQVEGGALLRLQMNSLGIQALTQQRRYAEAEKHCLELLVQHADTFTSDAVPYLCAVRLSLSRIKQQQKQHAQAVQVLEDGERWLAPRRQSFPRDFWSLRSSLAAAYLSWGQIDAAQQIKATSRIDALLSDTDDAAVQPLLVLQIRNAKAGLLTCQNQFDEAISLLEELSEELETHHASERMMSHSITMNLAQLYVKTNRLRQARSTYRLLLGMQYKLLGQGHDYTILTLGELSKICQIQKRFLEAAHYNHLQREAILLNASLGDSRLQPLRQRSAELLTQYGLQWFMLSARY
jgi:serine/threonine protein kinase